MDAADLPQRRPPPSHGLSRGPGLSRNAREWVVRWWAGSGGAVGSALRMVTLPLELAFRAGSGLRNRLYDGGALPLQRAPIPVISVGNLTVGGSGKTPLAAWLVKELHRRGERPALVSRGYGADEILLHRRWNPGIPVLAEEDRAYGAWKAARKGASVVILDDGFQHRRLARNLDVVLVAASTPRRVRLLPRGPFREPLEALRRAGLVILTQKGRSEDTLELEDRLEPLLREPPVRMRFVPGAWTDLQGRQSEAPEEDYLAVTGIADPDGFSRVLHEATGRAGEMVTFPDHYEYGWDDVEAILSAARGRTLVTTEKDAVKLAAFGREMSRVRVLGLEIEVLDGEARLWRHVEHVLRGRESAP